MGFITYDVARRTNISTISPSDISCLLSAGSDRGGRDGVHGYLGWWLLHLHKQRQPAQLLCRRCDCHRLPPGQVCAHLCVMSLLVWQVFDLSLQCCWGFARVGSCCLSIHSSDGGCCGCFLCLVSHDTIMIWRCIEPLCLEIVFYSRRTCRSCCA